MYCQHCGNELQDEATFCSKCGNQLHKVSVCEKTVNQPTNNNVYIQNQRGLKNTIVVFSIFSIFLTFGFFIPTLWKIPMLMTVYQRLKYGERITIMFKICYLLFVGIISGFLLFFVKNNKQ